MHDVPRGYGLDLADLDLGRLHGRVPELVPVLSLGTHRLVVEHPRLLNGGCRYNRHDVCCCGSGLCVLVGRCHFKGLNAVNIGIY